jgi:hypothetical protein
MLTEEDLCFALPYDVRVQGKSPAQILKMMASHARAVRPAQRVAPEPTPELSPAPVLPLEPLAVVEVSNNELQKAIGLVTLDTHKDTNQLKVSRPIGSLWMQQAFLRVIIDALMTQLYWSVVGARVSSCLHDQDAMRYGLFPSALAETKQATVRERCSRLE